MSIYGFTNDQGEPIMDGAAYRFEQQLDSEYRAERDADDYADSYDDEPEECDDPTHECNDCEASALGWHCSWCGRMCPDGEHSRDDSEFVC